MLGFLKKLSSRFRKDDGIFFRKIKTLTGISPKNLEHYHLAFRHSSLSQRGKNGRQNNQRLEFLGDAILGAVVADFLYENYPARSEGFLTSMRSKIVSRKHLNQVSLELGLNKEVKKKTARTAQAKSIYGDALEALIGAVYLDLGYECCCRFIKEKVLEARVDLDTMENRIASHKGHLLEWGQKHKRTIEFKITAASGKSHARKFEVTLFVDNEPISKGEGSSKKKAEEEAAKLAYKKLVKHGQNGEKTDAG